LKDKPDCILSHYVGCSFHTFSNTVALIAVPDTDSGMLESECHCCYGHQEIGRFSLVEGQDGGHKKNDNR
jgi:hypothetical protein